MNTIIGETKTFKLNKVDAKSLGIIISILHSMVGALVGIIVTIGSLVSDQTEGVWALGAWAILVLPIINAALGFATGFVLASLYNFTSAKFGGIAVEFEELR